MDPVHGKVLVAPWEYIQGVCRGWPDIGDGPIDGPFSKVEREMIDLMYTERYRPWCATGQISYMRKRAQLEQA
jgi:hypothetical protein